MKKTVYARIYTSNNSWRLTPQIEIQTLRGSFIPEDEIIAEMMINKAITHIVATKEDIHHIEIETLIHSDGNDLLEKNTKYLSEW